MKKLALVCIVALAFSTMAMANDIAFYVGQWNVDGWYSEQQFDDVDTIITQTGHLFKDIQQFDDDQFDAFGAWVEANTADGEMDIIWLNGCTPSVLYANPNVDADGSPAETWLDNGNMIINVGDWFAYCTYEGGSRGADNAGSGAQNILDLSGPIADSGQGSMEVTAIGQEYIPSLNAVTSDRPVVLGSVAAPWEVAAIFAENAAGTHADPVVIHNTETGGYFAAINQASGANWVDDRGLVCAEFIGNWVSVVVGLTNPSLASPLNPDDGVDDVPPDTVLEWMASRTAATHDVYFGTSFEDVNTASRDNPLGVLTSENQSATTFNPDGVLEFSTTYYWRIDEVNAAPDNTIFKGNVWSFIAEPVSYPIENIIATSNAISEAAAGPENTIDGSGLNEMDQHSVASTDMFLGKPSGDEPFTIQYEFDTVYKLHEMLVWNYNVAFELLLGFGFKDTTVEYSVDGAEWTALPAVTFAQATAKADYAANTTVAFDGVAAKYVRLTVNSSYDIGMLPEPQFGLSEVRFMYIPAQAREAQPADGDIDVTVETALSWRAGREAASHEVYSGTDPNALALADTTAETGYAPDTLDLATTYYWKVDEVNETDAISVWEGRLWSFTTQAFLVVDDFENYNDEDNLIYETWADGWVNDTGSTVGYLEGPFAETTIVNNGSQSMPLFYDNADFATSEADLDLSQDWTASGVKSLSLYFQGDPENSGGQLYVKINGTKVAYDGDAADITLAAWQAWNIDLSTVGNVSNVSKLTIGVEGAGASGVVYIDDVRLYPQTPEYIVPTEPDSAGLVALYKLDGDAGDGSGNGHNGTLNGDVQFGAGVEGSALDCDGVDDYVSTGKSASDLGIGGNGPRTVTVWVYTRSFNNGGIYDVGARTTGQDFSLRTLATQDTWRIQYWGGDFDFTHDTTEKWVHFAHVHDGTHTKIYANGLLIVDWEKTIDTQDANPFQIGLYGWPDAYFDGLIDELYLYNRVLSAEEVLGAAGQTVPRHKPF